MCEVHEHLERLLDDAVRFAPLHVDDEADAAGVAIVHRVVEALSGGLIAVGRDAARDRGTISVTRQVV